MQFDDRDLEDLVRICETEFGERITMKEAAAMAAELVALYEQLAKALPSETMKQSGDDARSEV